MAVILTDSRTIVDEGDAVTAWLSDSAAGTAVFTVDPAPIEATGSIGTDVSTETHSLYVPLTAVDHSAGTLIYVWALAAGVMDTLVNGGLQIVVGDATNRIGYHVAGSDSASFRYDQAGVAWQCLIMDTGSLPANSTTHAGAAAVSFAAMTDYGVAYKTLAKALGGTENCFTDIIRYGNGGLVITGGGVATEGNFSEIAVADRSLADQVAYGIAHEVASGVVGLQGPLTFGDSGGTAALDFLATSETVVFEDRGIGVDKYSITVTGNATGATSFILGTKVGTDGGSSGISLICPVGVGASLVASSADINTLGIYGCTISGFDQGVTFSSITTHEVYATTFSGCAQIDPGSVLFKNNTIANTTDATGGLLGNRDLDSLAFNSDGTGHGIYITTPGTYNYTTNSFSGYGAIASTDAVVYNNSAGLVTINVNSGDTPTYRNGAGATTTIVAGAVTIQATAITDLGTPVENAVVILKASDGTGPFPYQDTVTITRVTTVATVAHTAHGMATGDKIIIKGITDKVEDNSGVKTITVTGVNAYTYVTTDAGSTSYTGTIIVTFVALSGLTDINGEVSTSRVYSAAQPVTGGSRKSTSSPYLKAGVLTSSVSSTLGFTGSAVMVSDE